MQPNDNPYLAPAADLVTSTVRDKHYGPASAGQRLANLFIDYIAAMVLSFFIAVAAEAFSPGLIASTAGNSLVENVFGVGVMVVYYTLLEGSTGRSVGKLLTGTKVISNNGGSPGVLRVFWRSLLRFIPFDGLTYLRSDPVGLHDSASGTLVVRLRPSKLQRALERV